MHRLSNEEIARVLYEIGEYLEMQDEPFRPRAYEKAAEAVGGLQQEVADIYMKGGLKAVEEISGVGKSIGEKIGELLKTGKVKYHQQLKRKTPVDLASLTAIEGLGPKKIKTLYQKLKIKTLDDLEKAAKAGKIAKLEGFGKKSEENILQGIGFVKQSGGRMPLGHVMSIARSISERFRVLKEAERVEVTGSIRRRKETIGDIDVLVISSKPKKIMDTFTAMPEVARVYAKGSTKSSVRLNAGIDVDVRVIPKESYGAARYYFTGSKDHNVAVRKIAIKKGYKLSEYGLLKGKKQIAGRTEEELFKKLGMDYIPPEMREMTGEIEAAQQHRLPALVGYDDLKGDLQVQTNWTDGADSIEKMAKAAMGAGLDYIVITDHTKRLAMAHGLDEKRIVKQMAEIDKINAKFKRQNIKFRILKGSECDILKDGSLDLPDYILAKLDVVGASIHSYFNLSQKEQTQRMKRAMKNPNVDIIFHPTGRLINRRKAYELDMGEIIKIAKKTGTVLEINAFPDRLDLKDEYIRKCVEAKVKMSIDSDAHSVAHFSVLEFGIAQARRGWAEKKDIINAWPVEKMLAMLK